MIEIFKGSTSKSVFVKLTDSTTGQAKTGVTAAQVTASYVRTRSTAVSVAVAALVAANSAFSAGGWFEVDATNNKGIYRFDVPNLAWVTGADEVALTVNAAGCLPADQKYILVDWNKQVASIPNAAAGGAGGLVLADANNRVDVGKWLGTVPLALVNQLLQAQVIEYATGKAPLQPTVPNRTLDVTASGEAGIDFNNINQATAPTTLSNINIPTVGTVATLSGAVAVGAINANAVTANSIADAAVTKIQNGLALLGSEMNLTPAALLATGRSVELELINDSTNGEFMGTIANKLAQEFDIENLTLAQIASTTGAWILNRILAGNHETAGTLGKIIQGVATVQSVAALGSPQQANQSVTLPAGVALESSVLDSKNAALQAKASADAAARPSDVQVTVPTPVVNFSPTINPTPVTVNPTLTNDQSTKLDKAASAADELTPLIENGAFTVLALANAPTGGGASGGLTPDQNTRLIRVDENISVIRTRQNEQVPEPTPVVSIPQAINPAKAVVRVRTADFVGVPLVNTKVTLTLIDTKVPVIGDIIRSTRFVEGMTDKFGEVDLEVWSDVTLMAAKLKPTYKLNFANVELKIRVPPEGGLASRLQDPLG